jgi:hypothetical protein
MIYWMAVVMIGDGWSIAVCGWFLDNHPAFDPLNYQNGQ